jgi:hypothetical protein
MRHQVSIELNRKSLKNTSIQLSLFAIARNSTVMTAAIQHDANLMRAGEALSNIFVGTPLPSSLSSPITVTTSGVSKVIALAECANAFLIRRMSSKFL